MTRLQNWSRTIEFQATGLARPSTVEQLQEIVAGARRIRALGTRHSFNALADTSGMLVSTLDIPPDFVLDAAAGTVTFGSGTRYAAVAAFLQREGWALHNMGSLPHISVAGAIATGTHGSGDLNGSLSTAVRALEFVAPDGSLLPVCHGDADFDGSVVALGALGVVSRVTLAIEPTYLVRQDVYRGLDWNLFLEDVPAVTGSGYSVSAFTDWVSPAIEMVWVKRRVADAARAVPDELCGARRDPRGTQQIIASAEDNTTQHGVAGPWVDHLPHFRIDSTPSLGDEIQSEYFVAASDAAGALRAVRALGTLLHPHLLVSELRTVAADDLWLSPAFRRDSLAIHFTWRRRPEAVLALVGRIEEALEPFAPRPHWGKVDTVAPARLRERYPRFDDMRDLTTRRDPAGVFRGPHLERVLGLVPVG